MNSYDKHFEVWNANKKSGHSLLEKPAIYSLLPQLQGKSVLCIGCGLGEECKHIKSLGADFVIGTDISKPMLERAQETYPEIQFIHMDMQKLNFPSKSFDLVFSSLAIHYCENWEVPLKEMYRVLKDSGKVIFSTHHPSAWGAQKNEDSVSKEQLLGYTLNKKSGELKIYGDYFKSRRIEGQFFGKFDVIYYHKSFSQILREIKNSNFYIDNCVEPEPLPEAQQIDNHFWKINQKIPLFVIFCLLKKSNN